MPNIVYTVAEKVEMVRQHAQGLSYRRIVDHFAAAYPDRPIPAKTTVQNIVKKFYKTGNLDASLNKISQPKRRLTEETKLNICLTVEEGPKKPLSIIAQELNISKSSVHRIIRNHRHNRPIPYKFEDYKQLLSENNNSQKLSNHPNRDPSALDDIRKSAKTPNVVYTVGERVEMVRQHEQGLSYRRIVDHFAAAYPHRPIPSKTTVQNIVKKFGETGNLDPSLTKFFHIETQLTNKTQHNSCMTIEEDPEKPCSRIGQELDIVKSSVNRILQAQKHLPYNYQVYQQLLAQENKNQIIFSENVMVHLNADQDLAFLSGICFSDECTVELVGTQNKQNNNVWSQTEPCLLIESGTHLLIESGTHLLIESRTRSEQKLTVWVGMIENQLIGPFFIDGHLTGKKYLCMLRQQIVPALRAIQGTDPVIWFQQDSAPPYFTTAVQTYLNQEFPDRWIGRGGPVERPTRSSDLTLLDYPLWSYLKNRLHTDSHIKNLAMLRNRIAEVLNDMDPWTYSNMKF